MPHKFFYSWQSERPSSISRAFIRKALEHVSKSLHQDGIDERIEIDSDTQGVPGTPEIFSTVLSKIDEAAVFVGDLTICAETNPSLGAKRMYPNSNVMFEYGYALKSKGRSRLICVMNTAFGGNDPTELPFDLRHARAPIRFNLAAEAKDDERANVFRGLCDDLSKAAKLILDNLPNVTEEIANIDFQGPHFKGGDEITPEGDHPGQLNPTFFGNSPGFVFLRARPLKPLTLSISQIKSAENSVAGLQIADGISSGSFSVNQWGRVSYSLEVTTGKRISTDYVQYFRSGEIEIVNGSCFRLLGNEPVHLGFIVNKVGAMINICTEWMEKTGIPDWLVEMGIIGVERRQLTLQNFGRHGPLLHRNKVAVQRKANKESASLLAEEFRITLLEEAGLSV